MSQDVMMSDSICVKVFSMMSSMALSLIQHIIGGLEHLRQWHPTPVLFLAWKIQWTEEPGGLQSMGWLRVGHD